MTAHTATTTSAITALQTVHADQMDCVQVNLAVLADHYHGPGTHLALGAELNHAPFQDRDGLPTVEPPLRHAIDQARSMLGLSVVAEWAASTAQEVAVLSGRHDLLYLVADAYHLPWTPYHGQRHMQHSFLTRPHGDGVMVLDGYHNDTPWGSARPGQWELNAEQFAAAVPLGAHAIRLQPANSGPPRVEAKVDLGTDQQRAEYVRAFEDADDRLLALDKLSLQTWLLARYRRLHSQFRGERFRAAAQDQLRAWERLGEHTYLAYRRVQRNRPEPEGLGARLDELLAADRTVFAVPEDALGAEGPPGDGPDSAPQVSEELRAVVARAVGSVLDVDDATLLEGIEFTTVPTFSSFRLIDIVERLEHQLGLEFDPAELNPRNLHRVEDLCLAATRSRSTTAAKEPQ